MPSIQKRRVSVAEEIAALSARATKLETFPPNGGTVLAQASSNAAATMGTATGWQNVAFNYTGFAYNIRPIPFLAYLSVGVFYGSNTGTAAYVGCRAAMLVNDGAVGIDPITGVPLQSGASWDRYLQ